jgi:succinylglutamate desuccinylase
MATHMTSLPLIRLNHIPEGLLETGHQDVHKILPTPTLIELPGKHAEPLFVSVLLHGNEPSGLKAMQMLLKKYRNKELPRALALFIGNVYAAKHNLRRMDNQPDYNRIWPGTEQPDCPESELVAQVYALMKGRRVFASVDIHNNTGLNPHYACINRLENRFFQLASLFGRLAVYFSHPKGVQSAAFADICPAVTLECGRPDQEHGATLALEFLDSCLHLSEFPRQQVHPQDIDLYHTVAQVKMAENITFSFNDPNADFLLDKDIERFNFSEINAGTILGAVNNGTELPLLAYDDTGLDVTRQFFKLDGGQVQLTRPAMPSMLTLDERVIQQDCFCYLMERICLPNSL